MKTVGKPYAGKSYVRFDEGGCRLQNGKYLTKENLLLAGVTYILKN
ncbi:MAG: hypothetical protein JXB88_14940 [Spirochaetales bacterium]|nr:hypothetical protein [Spirochaetales bacterium]